jgi:crossover junction endodeoxyribonuclease RuvC
MKCNNFRVIGVDPGLQKTGWGVLDQLSNGTLKYIDSGTIYTESSDTIEKRLKALSVGLNEMLLAHQPSICVMEEVFINLNKQSSIKLCQARGSLILTVANNNVEFVEYSPRLIKQTVTGSGKADKEQIRKMLKLLLPQASPQTEDAADALAAAICLIQHNKFKNYA